MHPEPNVSGWAPLFLEADDQLAVESRRLHGLIGRRIVDTWVVWNLELDEWFADLPVVIRFDDDRQLEVCWEKFDDLSITWNTIDTSVTPTAWVVWPLEWRQGADPALTAIAGTSVTSLARTFSELNGHLITTGLWIGDESAGVHIYNALDENGLDDRQPSATAPLPPPS